MAVETVRIRYGRFRILFPVGDEGGDVGRAPAGGEIESGQRVVPGRVPRDVALGDVVEAEPGLAQRIDALVRIGDAAAALRLIQARPHAGPDGGGGAGAARGVRGAADEEHVAV